MDDGVQLTTHKKFLTVVPVVLFLLSWQRGDHGTLLGVASLAVRALTAPLPPFATLPHLQVTARLNHAPRKQATVVLVVAKLPLMHEVRLFGINKD